MTLLLKIRLSRCQKGRGHIIFFLSFPTFVIGNPGFVCVRMEERKRKTWIPAKNREDDRYGVVILHNAGMIIPN